MGHGHRLNHRTRFLEGLEGVRTVEGLLRRWTVYGEEREVAQMMEGDRQNIDDRDVELDRPHEATQCRLCELDWVYQ